MSPLPNVRGGLPSASATPGDKRAEDRAAAERRSAGDRALAQEVQPRVSGDFFGGFADRTVGVDGF